MKKILVFIFIILLLTGCEKKLMCSEGFILNEEDKLCYKNDVVLAETQYSCNAGETLTGTTCYYTVSTAAAIVYECSGRLQLSGTTCKIAGSYTDFTKCDYGQTYDFLSGFCYPTIPATRVYKCYVGNLVNASCVTEYSRPALQTLVCPEGYTLTGINCEKLMVETPYEE